MSTGPSKSVSRHERATRQLQKSFLRYEERMRPAQNRVTPTGDIAAIELRGRWMGNRGCLHEGPEIVRPWRSKAWIVCETSYKGWRMPQWAPGRYTVLFFHDEAVALAAGHRPCALCRRPAYRAFLDAWCAVHGGTRVRATELDAVLHASRRDDAGRQRMHERPWSELPDGTFVRDDSGAPSLVLGDRTVPWTIGGYGVARPRPMSGHATVLTPAPTVDVLRAGYVPRLDIVAG